MKPIHFGRPPFVFTIVSFSKPETSGNACASDNEFRVLKAALFVSLVRTLMSLRLGL